LDIVHYYMFIHILINDHKPWLHAGRHAEKFLEVGVIRGSGGLNVVGGGAVVFEFLLRPRAVCPFTHSSCYPS
jgi:hypothetical protein